MLSLASSNFGWGCAGQAWCLYNVYTEKFDGIVVMFSYAKYGELSRGCLPPRTDGHLAADDSHFDADSNANIRKHPLSSTDESPKDIFEKGPLYLRQRIFNRDSGTLIIMVRF